MNTGVVNRFYIFPRRPNLVGIRRTITTQPVPIRNRSIVGVTYLTCFTRLALSALLTLELGWTVAVAATLEPIEAITQTAVPDPGRSALGERLFHDVRLSHNNVWSCANCHPLDQGGMDGRARAITPGGTPSARNTPTVFNVALNAWLNWDGVANRLEVHAEKVLLSPKVMNTTWPELLSKLNADSGYVAAFGATFQQRPIQANVLDALASFERSLITPNARFDRYLRGEQTALTAAEQRGYELFKSYGCVACHQGMNIGGNLFQKFGVFEEPVTPAPPNALVDLGRFRVTKVDRDRGVFRVPSLRNVAVTGPYFHDGRAATLEEAVDIMANVQLGRKLSLEEIGLIVQFLRSLTGEYRGKPVAAAALEHR
jgi:cytochrome c peroxidase